MPGTPGGATSLIYLAYFLASFAICAAFVPLIRRLSVRLGMTQSPRADRWQHRPVSRLGGLAIYLAFALGLFIISFPGAEDLRSRWGLLACSTMVFMLGLVDDFHPLSPHVKLITQILISALAIGMGFTTDFFTPRLQNENVAQFLNVFLTFLWLVGITNAINLLDNMDGLAAGIALIAAGILGYFFIHSGDVLLAAISWSLAGSVAGFLIYNFPPASIFMGDSGSLFLGFTLAALAISRQPQASNVLAVMGVPILLFLLPILDTALVTVTRLLRGQSPVKGGRDHTSHRLIAFGLSERQTVIALYALAMVAGLAAASLEAIRYWYSLVLAPLLIISLTVLFAYLGGMKILQPEAESSGSTRLTRIVLDLAFRKRLMEVVLDFFIISLSFYLAYLVGYRLRMNNILMDRYLFALPVIIFSSYTMFFALGIYRSVWRYVVLNDLLRLFGAAVGSVVCAAGIFFLLGAVQVEFWISTSTPDPLVLLLFAIFLFLGLAASRSSFRIIGIFMPKKMADKNSPVLVYGAGEEGILLVDWMRTNPTSDFMPVGFIDDDPLLAGRWIHGLKVWGGFSDLEVILTTRHVKGIILAEAVDNREMEELIQKCQTLNCWVRRATLEFENIKL